MPDVAVFSKGRSVSDQQPKLPNRQMPFSEAFTDLIWRDWTPYDSGLPDPLPATAATAARRHALAALFPGERLVVPAGGLKVRSNDTDHRFRPHSAFAHLTGLGTDREPDAVLVLEPTDDGAVPTLRWLATSAGKLQNSSGSQIVATRDLRGAWLPLEGGGADTRPDASWRLGGAAT